jgi:predicted secreted protein
MAVGIKINGTDVTATVGGAALLGVLSKTITFNGETLDVTDDNSSGWQELAAVHGLKSLEMGFSGPLKNLELVGLYFGASQAVELVWTFADGVSTPTTITVDGVLSALSTSGDSNTPYTWDATFASSGAAVYVAAT